jgi:hypothetical protein
LGLKKRRQLAMETATTSTSIDGKRVRDAGCTMSQFDQSMRQRFTAEGKLSPAKVPCNGCTACCRHDRIMVDPAEETTDRLAHLELEPDDLEPDKLQLKHRSDGACVHLGASGCTVYEHRPTICRTYDCRVMSFLGINLKPAYGDPEPMWKFEVISTEDKVLLASRNYVRHLYEKQGGDRNDIPAYENFIASHIKDTKANMRKMFALMEREAA